MNNTKIIITRRLAYHYRGVGAAAQELGVTRKAVDRYLKGDKTISRDKAARLVIRTIKSKVQK